MTHTGRRAGRRPATAVLAGVLAATAAGVLTAPAAGAVTPVASTTTTTVSDPRLTWAPPALTSPTVVQVTETNRDIRLDPTRDYVVRLPATPLTSTGGLTISGGNDVVLVGGQIAPQADPVTGVPSRALYLKDQTGTIHVEGLHLTGRGLGEGINLDQRKGAVVQLQNVRVDTVHGSQEGNHADVIQTWAGPRQLRLDKFTGATTYQGFFLLPKQFGTQPEPELFDFRRVDLTGTASSGYMMWRDGRTWPLTVDDVHVAPRNPASRDSFLYPKGTNPGSAAWPLVHVGAPAGGSFVPAGVAGIGYVSPGYVTDTPSTTPNTNTTTTAAPTSGSEPAPSPSPSPSPTPTPTPTPTTAPADTQAPTFTRGPVVGLRTGSVSSSRTVPTTVAWTVTDESGPVGTALTSPVSARYAAGVSTANLAVGTGSKTWTLVAQDAAGNTRSASAARTLALVPETSATLGNYWWTPSGSHLLDGKARKSNRRGASMTYTFEGRGVSWIASKDASSGRAVVYLDGVKAATVDLQAGTPVHQQVVFARNWDTSARHTIKVVVEGTSGRPNVTSDGFITLR